MKTLILIALIWAGFHFYGHKVQEQYHEAKAQISGVSNMLSGATPSIGNPFKTSHTTNLEVAETDTKTNQTPLVICVAPNCSGMDCYPDLKIKIPVVMASNI